MGIRRAQRCYRIKGCFADCSVQILCSDTNKGAVFSTICQVLNGAKRDSRQSLTF